MWANEGQVRQLHGQDSWRVKAAFGSDDQVIGLFCFGWSVIRPPISSLFWLLLNCRWVCKGIFGSSGWVCGIWGCSCRTDFIAAFFFFNLVPLNCSRHNNLSVLFSSSWTSFWSLQMKSTARFPTVVSPILLYSSQAVVSLKWAFGRAGSCGIDVWVTAQNCIVTFFHGDMI